MEPEVMVIVTTKNNETIIKDCVQSIYSQSHANIKCIIADDGSTDRTLEIVKGLYPKTIIISNKQMGGPAANRNIALKEVTSPFVVFMDSDAVMDKDWVKRALKVMDKRPDIGMIGGKVFNRDGSIQAASSFYHITGVSGFQTTQHGNLVEYLWWPTSTSMARTEVVRKVGGFDDAYFYPCEDMDLSWRINIAGYKVIYSEDLHSTHNHKTTVRKEFQSREKRLMFMRKRNKMLTTLCNLESITILKYGWMIFGFVFAELLLLPYKRSILKGNLTGMFMVRHILDRRREIKTFRKVSDKTLWPKIDCTIKDMFSYGVPHENF